MSPLMPPVLLDAASQALHTGPPSPQNDDTGNTAPGQQGPTSASLGLTSQNLSPESPLPRYTTRAVGSCEATKGPMRGEASARVELEQSCSTWHLLSPLMEPSYLPRKVGTVVPISQVGSLKPRVVRQCALGHTVRKQEPPPLCTDRRLSPVDGALVQWSPARQRGRGAGKHEPHTHQAQGPQWLKGVSTGIGQGGGRPREGQGLRGWSVPFPIWGGVTPLRLPSRTSPGPASMGS